MLDFDAGKLMIIATVALVVIGPKDLPRVLRQFGQMVTRIKRMAGDFQNQFMDAMKEADIQELRDEVAKLKDTATLDVDFNPARDIKTQLDAAMDTPVPTPDFGSTSETTPLHLPSCSEVPSVAATGIGPVAEALSELPAPSSDAMVMAPETTREPDMVHEAPATEITPPVGRKASVVRRRTGSRFDSHAERPAVWRRSRNILPARRETPDQ